MAKIAYILLCHKDSDRITAQIEGLISAGDVVAVHYDASAPSDGFRRLKAAFVKEPSVVFAPRIRCGWGEWSLVKATLGTLRIARKTFQDASHFYLISGDCQPIKSAEYCHDYLDSAGADFIENVDFFTSGWIRTGFVEERLIYRHWFNERSQKWLFYTSFNLQRRFGMRRKLPAGLQIRIGSQWWCLRRSTVDALLEFTEKRRDVMRFFQFTWIPDETFFQTLVHHLVPRQEIRSQSPTFLMFSDYGMPVSFYNDHYELLLSQDALFARKISPQAHDLKSQLQALYRSPQREFTITNEGRRLFSFVTGKGRVGQRFAPRIWEANATLGRSRELLIVVCKKWHVARRFTEQLGTLTNLPALDYIFDENDVPLPDLGGIQTSLDKRTRHRRALVRMLFEHYNSDRLLICLDPSHLGLVEDFNTDACTTRVLEIDCALSDDYLLGHARRTGLLTQNTAPDVMAGLLSTIRNDVEGESEALRSAGLSHLYLMDERANSDDNAQQIGQFLSMPPEALQPIAERTDIFAD